MIGALVIGLLGTGIVLNSPAVQAAGSGSAGSPPRSLPIPASRVAPTGPPAATIRPLIPSTITFNGMTSGSIIEHQAFGGLAANFSDSAHPTPVASDYQASFDWGDGTPVFTTALGNVTIACGPPASAGTCNLDVAAHAYADEGIYTASATVSLVATPADSGSDTGALNAGEDDALTGTGTTVTGVEGTTLSGVQTASFTDTSPGDAADFTATVNWGDGTTSAGTVSGPLGGPFVVTGNHTYAEEGSYTVTTTVSDDAPGTVIATTTSSSFIGDADVLTGTGSAVTGAEGTGLSGVQTASFTDSYSNVASDFTATINWGDFTSSAGTVTGPLGGPFVVTGSHTYADEGSYTVTTTLTDDAPGTATGTITSLASIADADVLNGTGTPISTTTGTALSGVQTASFTDSYANGVADFTATINWGDFTSSTGTVSQPGGAGTPFKVTGSHTYATGGNLAVTTTLTDDAPGTATGQATSTATVTAVTSTSLSSSKNPSNPDDTVTYSATVAPVPDGGTVAFSDNGTGIPGCGAQPVNTTTGVATCAVTYPDPGTHTITANYSGDAFFLASPAAPLTQRVRSGVGPNQASTTTSLDSSANPSVSGQPVTFTATVSFPPNGVGSPTGGVTFFDGTTPIAGCSNVPVGGSAPFTVSCVTTFGPSAGLSHLITSTHSITAVYGGNAVYQPSTSPALLQNVVSSGPAATGGYWLVASDGGIFSFGKAGFFGSTGAMTLNKPIVGMASTPDGKGYWLVASDGGIFAYGDAAFFGSTGAKTLNKPIVGMASTPDGRGYWLVASDGGIFAYGDAGFFGSTGAKTLNKPIVGMASTPDGKGYWLVASDGGIFAYGDAAFFGSTGAMTLNKPIVGMASTPDGQGYWLVASDGGIFAYGDAAFFGSTGAKTLNKPIVGMSASPDGRGYWLVASDGGIFAYGDAAFFGSTGAMTLNKPIVGMAGD
jgi:hypothetical protein